MFDSEVCWLWCKANLIVFFFSRSGWSGSQFVCEIKHRNLQLNMSSFFLDEVKILISLKEYIVAHKGPIIDYLWMPEACIFPAISCLLTYKNLVLLSSLQSCSFALILPCLENLSAYFLLCWTAYIFLSLLFLDFHHYGLIFIHGICIHSLLDI